MYGKRGFEKSIKMEEKRKTYTAADFANYHSGNMASGEMHALEKAALEDPFLADALEGYRYTSQAAPDIQRLKVAVTNRVNRKKVFSTGSVRENLWWRVAAVFILVGLAGYFIFNISNNQERPLAKQERSVSETPLAGTTKTVSPVGSEEITRQNNSQSTEGTPGGERTTTATLPGPSPSEISSSQRHRTESDLKTNGSSPPIIAKTSPAPEERKASGAFLQRDDSLNAAAFTPPAGEERVILQAERTSDFNRKTLKDKPALAYARKQIADSPQFLLRQAKDSVVAQAATKEETPLFNQEKGGKVAGTNPQPDELFEIPGDSRLRPKEGQERFAEYLAKHRTPVRNAIGQLLHGKIQLQFEIDDTGKPKNITILKSACKACELQAVELLEKGPSWEGDILEKGILILNF